MTGDVLLKVGEECIKREKFDSAIEVFQLLGNKAKLIDVGDKCIHSERTEALPFAEKAYAAADEKKGLTSSETYS